MMFIYFALIFLIGAVCLVCAFKKEKGNRGLLVYCFICFSLPMCCLVAGELLSLTVLPVVSLFFSGGAMLAGVAVFDHIRYRKCTELIQATCIEKRMHYSRNGSKRFSPVFAYRYEAKSYNSQGRAVKEKLFDKMYGVDETVSIYIDPDLPSRCYDKRLSRGEIAALFILGVFILLLGILIVAGYISGIVTIKF